MKLSNTALFVSLLADALKPNAVEILDTICKIADSMVSASAQMDVRATELALDQE